MLRRPSEVCRSAARGLGAGAALFVCLIAPAEAWGGERADAVARALESDPVYVHPAVVGRLPPADQGRIRIRIVEKAIGRIKIAVVPEVLARREGGVAGLANNIDRTLQPRGALIVVAGPAFHVITSHPRAEPTVVALRSAITRHREDGLAEQLLAGVSAIARVDPGVEEDLRGPVADSDAGDSGAGDAGAGGSVPAPDDAFDGITDAFRLGVLIVAGAIALPFLLGAGYFLVRVRRRAAQEEEMQESSEQAVRRGLVVLGEGIRSLDLDTSMPGADRRGLAEYEQAIARYDQANELLTGDPSAYRIQQARAAIDAGARHIEAARGQLG
jgi:hypothetical protein